jgi:hypothetical protein
VPHPKIKSNDELNSKEENGPIFYELVEEENGYFERRDRQDWADMPNLWGPWDDE